VATHPSEPGEGHPLLLSQRLEEGTVAQESNDLVRSHRLGMLPPWLQLGHAPSRRSTRVPGLSVPGPAPAPQAASEPLAGLVRTRRTMIATVASPATSSTAKSTKFPHCELTAAAEAVDGSR